MLHSWNCRDNRVYSSVTFIEYSFVKFSVSQILNFFSQVFGFSYHTEVAQEQEQEHKEVVSQLKNSLVYFCFYFLLFLVLLFTFSMSLMSCSIAFNVLLSSMILNYNAIINLSLSISIEYSCNLIMIIGYFFHPSICQILLK